MIEIDWLILMKLSTKTRYGVRLMVDLACRYGEGPVFLKDIALREDISEKYLSQIVIPLRKAGLLQSARGAHGGYSLAGSPADITLRQIIEPLEGVSPVDCVKDPSICHRVPTCATRDIWAMLGDKIAEALDSVTLEDLAEISRDKSENDLSRSI